MSEELLQKSRETESAEKPVASEEENGGGGGAQLTDSELAKVTGGMRPGVNSGSSNKG